MKKATKIWLITAAALILAGGILFCGVMTGLGWDFTKLSTSKYETREYDITQEFDDILILTDTADIVFLPSQEQECRVVCYEQPDYSHTVAVKDGILWVELTDTQAWHQSIGIHLDSPKITVYLPAGAYGALTVKTDTGDASIPKEFQFESVDISLSTGDITLQGVSVGALDLTVSTGDVILTDVTCQDLRTSGNTGDLTLTHVIASGMFSIRRTTGDVTLEACDAAEISIKTNTGDVRGSLLTDKEFYVKTDTGDREYPHMTTGGKCEIITTTGDVKVEIQP